MASGAKGSSIEPRPISKERILELLFGPTKAKQKPLKINAKGELTTLSLSRFSRKMNEETKEYFEALFI